MLATRVRVVRTIAIGAMVALALAAHLDPPRVVDEGEGRAVDRATLDPVDANRDRPRTRRRCDVETVHSKDTLEVVLHAAPAWTGVDVESDWSKSFRMVWDGPIASWTTMRQIRVPSLDHRMIESIEPAVLSGEGELANAERTIRVKVRVIVPGDLEAALAWVARNPAVESARVEASYVP